MKNNEFGTTKHNLKKHLATGIWHIHAKVNGRLIRRSLKTTSHRDAKQIRDNILKQEKARVGVIDAAAAANLVLADLLDLHLAEIKSSKLAESSKRTKEAQIKSILKTDLPTGPLRSLSYDDIRLWWESASVIRFSESVQNKLLAMVRRAIKLGIRRGALLRDPSAGIKYLEVIQEDMVLPTNDEFRSIVLSIRTSGRRNAQATANLVEFLAYSGARISEARAFRWEDVHWHKNQIALIPGKGKVARRVPLTESLRDLLKRLHYEGACGQVFSIANPQGALRAACKRLEIVHCSPHTMRHFFATNCAEQGVDFRTLALWLGHKDKGVLAARIYCNARDDHSQQLAAQVKF